MHSTKGYTTEILQSLFKSQKHWDVTLVAVQTGSRICAHKCILSAASDYFDSMFSGSFVESHQPEINLHDIPGSILESLLSFVYGASVVIEEESVLDMLRACNLLKISHVEKCCWEMIKSNLDPENAVEALLLSEQLGNEDGFRSVLGFLGDHFNEIRLLDSFCTLNVLNLKKILSSNNLKIKTEQNVFEALRTWITFDEANRLKYVPELIQLIRLPLLTEKFIQDHLVPFCPDDQALEYINEGLKWHKYPPESRTLCRSQNIQPRKSLHGKILAVSYSLNRLQIHTFCPLSHIWTADVVLEEGTDLSEDSLCMWDESLILVTDVIRRYSFRTDKLEILTSFPGRSEFATAEVNGSLYFMGGRRRHVLSVVQRLDTCNNWHFVPSMETPRENPGAVVRDGKIYVIGGWSSSEILDSVECYNPERNSWTRRMNLNEPRYMPEVVLCKGIIYVFGGFQGLEYRMFVSAIEKYNRDHSWEIIGNIEEENMLGISVVSFEDRIFLLKDTDNNGALFGEYLPETDTFLLLNSFIYEPSALNIKYAKLLALKPWQETSENCLE